MPRLGLSASQLARMRAEVAQLLPNTCTIQQPTNTKDGKGGVVQTWSTAVGGANVPCRLDPMDKPVQADEQGQREAIVNQRRLTVPYDAPLAVDYRVIVGSETYEIRDLADDGSWRPTKRAIVTKVEGT